MERKSQLQKKISGSLKLVLLAAILMPYVHGISILHLASSSCPQDSKDASRATWKKVKARVPRQLQLSLLALQLRDWKMLEASNWLNNINIRFFLRFLSWQYKSYLDVEAHVQVRQCESFKHLFIPNIAQLWWYVYSCIYQKHHSELIPPNVKSKSTLQEPLFGQMERATLVNLVKTTFTAPANTGPVGFQAEPGFDELTCGWSCCLIDVPSHLKLADARWSDGRHYHGQWSKNTLHGLGDMRLSGSCGSCEALNQLRGRCNDPPEMHTCKNPFALT